MPDHIDPAAIPGDNLRPDMVEIAATRSKRSAMTSATRAASSSPRGSDLPSTTRHLRLRRCSASWTR